MDILVKVIKWMQYMPSSLSFGKWLTEKITKEKFFVVDEIYSIISQKIEKRLILFLPGKGCAWYKKSGGCTMCGFGKKIEVINQKWMLTAKDLSNMARIAIILTSVSNPKSLWIYNGGSFLNPDEIPIEAQKDIVKMVREHSTIKLLFIESRPEYIDERILSILKALNHKILEVGIGLEAVTDWVREELIHKGFDKKMYERAVHFLKKWNIKILTYVFLKPIGLSEEESIEEAVRTIEYAFLVGTDEVSLSCAFIQEGTQMAEAYKRKVYSPPQLWSIIEVIKRAVHLGPIRIGSFEDQPTPVAIPKNCGKCDKKVIRAIQQYNLTRDIKVFEGLNCNCKKKKNDT